MKEMRKQTKTEGIPRIFFSSFHSSNFGPFVLRLFFVCKLSGFISSLGSQIIWLHVKLLLFIYTQHIMCSLNYEVPSWWWVVWRLYSIINTLTLNRTLHACYNYETMEDAETWKLDITRHVARSRIRQDYMKIWKCEMNFFSFIIITHFMFYSAVCSPPQATNKHDNNVDDDKVSPHYSYSRFLAFFLLTWTHPLLYALMRSNRF